MKNCGLRLWKFCLLSLFPSPQTPALAIQTCQWQLTREQNRWWFQYNNAGLDEVNLPESHITQNHFGFFLRFNLLPDSMKNLRIDEKSVAKLSAMPIFDETTIALFMIWSIMLVLLGSYHVVVANLLDCDIVESEFEIQLCYVYFWINSLMKGMNLLIPTAMGLIAPLLFCYKDGFSIK